MHGDLLLVVGILIFGCAAFLFGVCYLLWSGIEFIGTRLVRLGRPRQKGEAERTIALRCPRERCGSVEHRRATFCSQCGARLVSSARSGEDRDR